MRYFRLLLPLVVALVGLLGTQQFLVAISSEVTDSETAVSRPHDPIILAGSNFSAFANVLLDELVLYRYQAGQWQPIPFQIDEVDEAGNYVTEFNGRLGANDELVFMNADSGAWADPDEWVSDIVALQHPRYLITITDPLTPDAVSWVYLYRSTTLPRSQDGAYVNWNNEMQQATAVSYTLAFDPDNFLGIASLALNNQPQTIIDRQKLRLEGSIFFQNFAYDEETILTSDFVDDARLTLPITGPVRAIGSNDLQQAAFYGHQATLSLMLDIPSLVTVNHLRLSLDLANPTDSGLAPVTYYDDRLAAGVPVDGQPDTVPEQPLAAWQQIDGSYGSFVSLLDLSVGSGQPGTYYLDDDTEDQDDTGDGRSYGDAGFFITNPSGQLQLTQTIHFLSGQQGNQGDQLAQQAAHPLQTSNSLQFPPGGGPGTPTPALYLPLIINGN